MNNISPAIVIVAFNRAYSLGRLLKSIKNAVYSNKNIPLIISIDQGKNKDVLKVANDFIWEYGVKEVIYQKENLGLKKHILQCGDLTEKYDSIILLEDDLYVSPFFYDYALQSIQFYRKCKNISQISLYKHPLNNNTNYSFLQLETNKDSFFLQFASSWGQIWTVNQWHNFRKWFNENDLSISQNDNLPNFVIGWKETSWLKYFIKYNQENDMFVVYPKISLTSNFSDRGINVTLNKNIYTYQQSLMMESKIYNFDNLENSISVYDVYYELHEIARKNLNILRNYDSIEFDLYGTKKLSKIKSKYLVSVKKCSNPIKTYTRSMKPHEVNILNNLDGNEISFGLTIDFKKNININILKENHKYFWTHVINYMSLFYLLKIRINQQAINIINRLKRLL